MAKTRSVIDASNILFRVASMSDKRGHMDKSAYESEEQKAGFALHVSFNTMLKYYKKYKPDEIALAFEGGKNWRKAYTAKYADELPVQYKANRVWDSSKQTFFELIDSFKNLIKEHSSIICLAKEGLEGDDVIAGYAQRFTAEGDEVYAISGDRDFIQLYGLKNFHLIDPATGKERIQEEKDFDPNYFIFEKCIRGDAGDNVMSAYPRVRSTKLQKAFTDSYAMEQLMKEEWSATHINETTGEETKRTYTVGNLYKHNVVLLDLFKQPPEIRAKIDEAIDEAHQSVGKFSFFHFMKFLGANNLNQIADNAQIYADMMSITGREQKRPIVEENQKIDKSGTMSATEFLARRRDKAAATNKPDDDNNEKFNGIFEF